MPLLVQLFQVAPTRLPPECALAVFPTILEVPYASFEHYLEVLKTPTSSNKITALAHADILFVAISSLQLSAA